MDQEYLRNLLAPISRTAKGYVCEITRVSGDHGKAIASAARELGRRIVSHRCPEQWASKWEARRDGGPEHPVHIRLGLIAFLEADFGAPDRAPDPNDADRLEGAVAEYLWWELIRTRRENDRDMVRVEPPSFAVTDPGGDGLIIYRSKTGELTFRLWEIKKYTGGDDGARATVTGAHRQLKVRALSYLARYSKIGNQLAESNEQLKRFYAQLVDHWMSQGPEAGAGVAIATSYSDDSEDLFSGLPDRFPELAAGARLEGQLSAIGQFSAFALSVRREIWSGL